MDTVKLTVENESPSVGTRNMALFNTAHLLIMSPACYLGSAHMHSIYHYEHLYNFSKKVTVWWNYKSTLLDESHTYNKSYTHLTEWTDLVS